MNLDEIFGLKHGDGELCVSIVLPTYKKGTEARENPAMVKKALHDVKGQLKDHHKNDLLIAKLDKLASQIDYEKPSEGLGFFVSNSTEKLFQFDFPVRPSVLIGDVFDLRSLVADANQALQVAVLSLSGKSARLYLGTGHNLVQIEDERFPRTFKENYEYPKPGPISLHNSSQRGGTEKSRLAEKRTIVFFRSIDKALKVYLDMSHLLIIMGTEEDIALFRKITDYQDQIISTIPGNYEHMGASQIAEIIYPELEDYIARNVEDVIAALAEDKGKNMAANGLSEVWEQAVQGNVRVLLVEKDFNVSAYKSSDSAKLHLRAAAEEDIAMPDVVDDIIEKVLEKHGQVLFSDNEMLNNYGHIAALLRYPI